MLNISRLFDSNRISWEQDMSINTAESGQDFPHIRHTGIRQYDARDSYETFYWHEKQFSFTNKCYQSKQ